MQSQATAVGASREFIESSGSIGRIFNIGSSAYSTGKAYSVRTHGRKFKVYTPQRRKDLGNVDTGTHTSYHIGCTYCSVRSSIPTS